MTLYPWAPSQWQPEVQMNCLKYVRCYCTTEVEWPALRTARIGCLCRECGKVQMMADSFFLQPFRRNIALLNALLADIRKL